MGAAFDIAKQQDETYVMHTFVRKPVEFVRGEGMKLYDDEGCEYRDFLSGIGVVSVGHSEPSVVAAIQEQAAKLLHVSNYYYVEHRGTVAQRITGWLKEGTGTDWQIFFANSGAEANEGAIKTARRWGKIHANGNYGIISANKSFHGRTYATLAATAQDAKQDPFAPLPGGFASVPLNDIEAMEQAVKTPVDGTMPVAVLLEPVQGESGVWPCTKEYLQAVRRLCDENNMLLIFDEVQTGFFRCGTPFAFMDYGVKPDIVSMAKGIAGGVPMGAFAARADVAAVMEPGMHGTTFGGSPLACAASEAVTSIMLKPEFAQNINETGAYLREQLAKLPFVKEVRGKGLMCGITLDKPVAAATVLAGLEHGLVLNNPAADIMRFLPPLVCGKEDVDFLISKLPACYEGACNA